jgi:DHA1 family inner membrane transport protein
VLARLALSRPGTPARAQAASWYGFVALALALPYPVLKTWWALGGSFGLRWPGADGLAGSLTLWLPAVPWLLAAALSLLLVLTPRWLPRRLLLVAGWSATVIVATFGPAACWSLVSGLIDGDADFGAMAGWVFGLFYGSWLLWAIAAGAATRSYQLRSSGAVARVAGTAEMLD